MNASRFIVVSVGILLMVALCGTIVGNVQGQAGPRLIGFVETELSDGWVRNLAVDDAGRVFVRSAGLLDPPMWRTGWVLIGQLPAGSVSAEEPNWGAVKQAFRKRCSPLPVSTSNPQARSVRRAPRPARLRRA